MENGGDALHYLQPVRGGMPGQSGVASWLLPATVAMMPHPFFPNAINCLPAKLMVNVSVDPRPVYTIDSLDRVVAVNAAWVDFMRQENHAGITLQSAIGRPVWDFVAGSQVRQLWEVLYERVRAVGAPVFVPTRMDTPSLRRLIDLELHPLGDRSIQHVCECVWIEARPAVALLDPAYPRDERTLQCCAWCNRIQVRIGAWEEIEEAQLTLRIEATSMLPRLKAGVCSTCKQSVLKTFPARVA